MRYKETGITNWQEISAKYQVGSLVAKVASSFAYSQEDLDSFFHGQNYQKIVVDDSLEQVKQVLLEAKEQGQKVWVYGDYDCDGLSATTIMIKCLRKLDIECGYYIPDRLKEGYGLNIDRIRQASQKGYQVLLTVDTGVSCQEELLEAKKF